MTGIVFIFEFFQLGFSGIKDERRRYKPTRGLLIPLPDDGPIDATEISGDDIVLVHLCKRLFEVFSRICDRVAISFAGFGAASCGQSLRDIVWAPGMRMHIVHV